MQRRQSCIGIRTPFGEFLPANSRTPSENCAAGISFHFGFQGSTHEDFLHRQYVLVEFLSSDQLNARPMEGDNSYREVEEEKEEKKKAEEEKDNGSGAILDCHTQRFSGDLEFSIDMVPVRTSTSTQVYFTSLLFFFAFFAHWMRPRRQSRCELRLGFLSGRIGGWGCFYGKECWKFVGGERNLVDESALPRRLMSSGFRWEVCHDFGWLEKIDGDFLRTRDHGMTDFRPLSESEHTYLDYVRCAWCPAHRRDQGDLHVSIRSERERERAKNLTH